MHGSQSITWKSFLIRCIAQTHKKCFKYTSEMSSSKEFKATMSSYVPMVDFEHYTVELICVNNVVCCVLFFIKNICNNNGYLEHLTCTGPGCLQIL